MNYIVNMDFISGSPRQTPKPIKHDRMKFPFKVIRRKRYNLLKKHELELEEIKLQVFIPLNQRHKIISEIEYYKLIDIKRQYDNVVVAHQYKPKPGLFKSIVNKFKSY